MSFVESIGDFAANNAGGFALLTLGVGAIALLIAFAAFLRMKAIMRPLASVRKHAADGESLVSAVVSAVENNSLRIEALARSIGELSEKHRSALQHYGLVRYDAFEDIGGQQSFSLCLLDGDKNGVLISYITGRNSARSYAVTISSGVPARKLGEEEVRAMDEALTNAQTAASL